MDITSLRGMTQEEQLLAADAYAGVAPGTMASIWSVESGKGTHKTMLGPETKWGKAKGHFQILDYVHDSIQSKLGMKLDRFDFTEALVGASEIMKENKARYGDDEQAIMAYHGGTNKKNWGAKTKEYVQKVRGTLPKGSHVEEGGVVQEAKSFEQYFRGDNTPTALDVASVARDSDVSPTILASPATQNIGSMSAIAASRTRLEEEQAKADSQQFFGLDRSNTLGAAYSRTMTPMFDTVAHTLMDEPVDREYLKELAADSSVALQHIQNPTPEEAELLLHTTSRDDLALAINKINTQREDSIVLARAGTGKEMTAMLMAGALDPTTYATGFAAAKAFHLAGYGATALAQAGRGGAAVASVVAENVVGNVAYDAVQHALGEHKSVADYGLSAVTGMLPGMVQAPFAMRAARNALEARVAREGIEAQVKIFERAKAELGPSASIDEVRLRASEIEAAEVQADRAARLTAPPSTDKFDAPDIDSMPLRQDGAPVEAKAAQVGGDGKVDVAIVDSSSSGVKDLPSDAKAVFDPATGKVQLFRDRMTEAELQNPRGLLLHEVGVHYGLERAVGKELMDKMVKDIQASADLRAVEARGRVPTGTNPADSGEEVLGYLAEGAASTTGKQVVAAVRNWLRDNVPMFKGMTVTVDDAVRYIQGSMDAALGAPKPVVGNIKYSKAQSLPEKYGTDTMPVFDPRERMEKKFIEKGLADAETWVANNPQDPEKLKTIMNNSLFNMATPGMVLAQSSHPVAKMVSGIMVENTMGASGRKVTAAIRKAQYEREFVGNALIHYDSAYAQWRNLRAGRVRGIHNDIMSGSLRDEFNRAVSTELENRLWKRPLTTDASIKRAADELQVSYERMRAAQIEAKTPGWANLPESSVGYFPHKTDAAKFLRLSPAEVRAYRGALKDQLMAIEDMDEAFADKVAGAYLDHARINANGGHEIPASIHDAGAADYVRQAMKAAGMDYQEIEQFANRLAAGGASHTKRRLNLDLTTQYTRPDGTQFTLLDLFSTDHTSLLRNQARRVGGEVALAQQGIMGSAGLKLVERMLQFWPAGADPKERVAVQEAFQQVAAEMLGKPYGDATPTWLDGALTANSAANLGGMGFTQLAEYINIASGVGIDGAFKAAGSMPRLIAEVRALARGEKVENSWLSSMEIPGGGGEFGLTGYKMVTKYDSPSAVYESVGRDSIGAVSKVIRLAGHGLSSVSMHRMIQAVQVRGAAEQITQKAIRYIRDGVESKALADMGFTPELSARIKADLPNIAKFDSAGRIVGLDMRKAQDVEAAGAFVSSVHRGAAQLIQDSFVGEVGKWQHSALGKVLSQFRSFPLTAMEKQWGRQRAMRGVPVAVGMIIAAAPFATAIHLARVAVNASGRPDMDDYIDKQTSPLALARATMNYLGMLGVAPDIMDALSAPMPDEWKQAVGGEATRRAPSTGSVIPLIGYVDNIIKGANNIGDNPHMLMRALPYSNTPFITPMVNAMRNDSN